jgi:H+-transporting ATPase
MAEHNVAAGHGATGHFDEKAPVAAPAPAGTKYEDEEPDEDMDALIEDLESQDGHMDDEEEEVQPGGGRVVPEDMLQTDTRVGLTESEVLARRKKYGLNQMKEEKENLILKFFGFFIGPIQFVMEVSIQIPPVSPTHVYTHQSENSACKLLATLLIPAPTHPLGNERTISSPHLWSRMALH